MTLTVKGHKRRVHVPRSIYCMAKNMRIDDLPINKVVGTTCHNVACCHPDHLELKDYEPSKA